MTVEVEAMTKAIAEAVRSSNSVAAVTAEVAVAALTAEVAAISAGQQQQ